MRLCSNPGFTYSDKSYILDRGIVTPAVVRLNGVLKLANYSYH